MGPFCSGFNSAFVPCLRSKLSVKIDSDRNDVNHTIQNLAMIKIFHDCLTRGSRYRPQQSGGMGVPFISKT